MPQRFLKPGLRSSRRFEACSWQAQSFYVRLISLVDDYGRYEADAVLLKSETFPLREDIRAPQVQSWMDELRANHLADFYKADGKEFLQLTNWTERPRSQSKYPPPSDNSCSQLKANANSCAPPKSSSKPSSSSESKPSPSPQSLSGGQRPNSPTIAEAQAFFVALNEREKPNPPYSAAEVKQAWLWFEGHQDPESRTWLQPFSSQRKPVGDWRAVMEERMLHQRRNPKPVPQQRNEIQKTIKSKRDDD